MGMSDGDGLSLLVVAGEASFAADVADALETTPVTAAATIADSGADPVTEIAATNPDGVVVGGAVDTPAETIDRLVTETDVPIVLLADADEALVSAAVEAGVADIFPRTAATSHGRLVADRIATLTDNGTDTGTAAGATGETDIEATTGTPDDERAYHAVFENVSDGLVLHELDTGEIVDINDRFCEMNGYDRTELIGEDIGLVTAPGEEYSDEAAREMIERARSEGAQLFEWRNQRRNGETYPVEVHLAVLELDGAERVLASVRDITERRELERTYQGVFENVSDGLVVHDPETGEIREVNQQYCELTGYDRAELVGSNIRLIVPDDPEYSFERAIEHIERARGAGPQLFEFTGQRRDGDTFVAEVHLTTVELRGEEQVLASVRDITERKRREREYEQIFDGVNDSIVIQDPETAEPIDANQSFLDRLGYESVAEIRERGLEELSATDAGYTKHRARELCQRVIETGEAETVEWQQETKEGARRWIEATVDAAEIGGEERVLSIQRDITERKRRERTLETFHEATRELTAADSREAACRQAVQAAEEVLGFPLVSVYRYDEESGALEPTALTSRLRELDVDPLPFGPGDSVLWKVFVEGETITSLEPTTAVYGPGVSDPDIVLPIGSHGVMLVGTPDGEFDAEDVELAQILAATLEAALNHVTGERELAEREAELRRQQERADRLEQLNTIIRDIEQATVEQSSRAGIEGAVCERLVDVADHDFVWVAEPTVGDDGLVPRTSAGGPEGYVDGLTGAVDATAEAGADSHPAVAAYRTNETRAVENVATDIATGEWRKHALGHGIQSVVAVPIRHETTTHGVLSVASAAPDAFDEATREVLADLGRSIGYAITVTEREQALESDGTTELEFSVGDEGLFMIRGATTADCHIELERTIRRTGGSFSMFYAVKGADPATVVELADAAPSVATAQVVSANEAGTGGLVEVTVPTWFGSVFTKHGAVVRKATADSDEGTLVVEAPRGTDVRALVEGFQERYPDAELVAQRQRERTIRSLFELQDALETELTDRQWEALETAYSAGYFGWPRETSGQEVAELLGVSQPTFNKHLRIAEQSAFRMLLDREYPAADK